MSPNESLSGTIECEDSPEDPPSVLAILAELGRHERMTGADLRESCGLPRRTLYGALRTLRERGDIKQRRSLQDTRQYYFWLAEDRRAQIVPGETAPVTARSTHAAH